MDARSLLEPVYRGRRVLLVAGPVQGKRGMVAALRELGAADCLVIGSAGSGPCPEAECLVVDVPAADPMDDFRQWERIAAAPPPDVAEAVERFAPDLTLANGFEASTTFAGRPVFGARPPEWTGLEDKVTVDALWDEAGIDRAPTEVMAVDRARAWQAHRRLDRGEGTVWSGDARDGWHGGGELVRRVRSAEEADRAHARFTPHCDRLRVMPFLEGLPCSIHGLVTDADVAAFRPVELVVLRTPGGFRYCATATTWDPTPVDREAMRQVARRVGALLRRRWGFRGLFTVDGVMTTEGFRPTELNPRVGAGLNYVSAAVPELPLALLQFAVVAGAVGVDAAELEAAILPAAQRTRLRACHTPIEGRRPGGEEMFVDGDLTLVLGPGPLGAFLRVTAERTPDPGEPFAPTAVKALALADERWALGLGPLAAAPIVR